MDHSRTSSVSAGPEARQALRAQPAPRVQSADVPRDRHPATVGWPRYVKRAADLAGALAMLVASAPALLAIALIIKATSSGPVIFRQTRLGLDGRPFTLLKFRTMTVDAEARRQTLRALNEARGAIFKIAEDPRRTFVGGLLRRTSLDELPQVINVLRGDMSLVGPRPVPQWVAAEFGEVHMRLRGDVLPGLTGLWQVNGRVQDSAVMQRFDREYVERWSLWLDLAILARTPVAVIRGEGA